MSASPSDCNVLKFSKTQIQNCHKATQKARNSLLHRNDDNEFQAKVCAVCDTFIKYNEERPINVEWLLNNQVKECLSVSKDEWNDFGILEEDRIVIEQHYTQRCISRDTDCAKNLKQLMLSHKSYKIEKPKPQNETNDNMNNKTKKQENKIYLGACSSCYQHIKIYMLIMVVSHLNLALLISIILGQHHLNYHV